jgi:hypothetical protein
MFFLNFDDLIFVVLTLSRFFNATLKAHKLTVFLDGNKTFLKFFFVFSILLIRRRVDMGLMIRAEDS